MTRRGTFVPYANSRAYGTEPTGTQARQFLAGVSVSPISPAVLTSSFALFRRDQVAPWAGCVPCYFHNRECHPPVQGFAGDDGSSHSCLECRRSKQACRSFGGTYPRLLLAVCPILTSCSTSPALFLDHVEGAGERLEEILERTLASFEVHDPRYGEMRRMERTQSLALEVLYNQRLAYDRLSADYDELRGHLNILAVTHEELEQRVIALEQGGSCLPGLPPSTSVSAAPSGSLPTRPLPSTPPPGLLPGLPSTSRAAHPSPAVGPSVDADVEMVPAGGKTSSVARPSPSG